METGVTGHRRASGVAGGPVRRTEHPPRQRRQQPLQRHPLRHPATLSMALGRGMLLTAALVLALTSMLAVVQQLQLQWPRPVLRLWASGVVGLERVLGAETAFLPGVSVTEHQTPRPIEVVVVLGYKVFGDGVPSPLLHLRLAAGAATLTELAEEGPVQLILSGGVPPDVPGRRGLPSEAEAMRNHMHRCFPNALNNPNVSVTLEPAAHSTHTNAVNTLTQLQAQHHVGGNQRPLSVTVATNRFHQLRSLRVFRAAGHRLGLSTDHLLLTAAPIPYSLSVAAQQQYVDNCIYYQYIMASLALISKNMLVVDCGAVQTCRYTTCPGREKEQPRIVVGGVVSASSTRSSSVWEQAAMTFDTSAQSCLLRTKCTIMGTRSDASCFSRILITLYEQVLASRWATTAVAVLAAAQRRS